jgi:hypothetical protein
MTQHAFDFTQLDAETSQLNLVIEPAKEFDIPVP